MDIIIDKCILSVDGVPYCCAVGGDPGIYMAGISNINGRNRPVLCNTAVITTASDVACPSDIAVGQTLINGSVVNGRPVAEALTQRMLDAINSGESVTVTVAVP